MNKSRHVTFRCTPLDYKCIKDCADANSVSVSKLLVAVFYEWYVGKPKKDGVNTPLSQEQLNQAIEK